MGFAVKDAGLKVTRALPASASGTVYGTALDLGESSKADFLANVEFILSAPAVNATMAPDTRTFTYSIVSAATTDLSSSPTVLYSGCIVQTGASSAGAAASPYTFRLPVDNTNRYIGIKIVSGASTGDASSVTATLEGLV